MLPSLLVASLVPALLAAAHGHGAHGNVARNDREARQVTTTASASSSSVSTVSGSPAASSAATGTPGTNTPIVTVSGSVTLTITSVSSLATNFSFSLLSTNPTAVPLSSIVVNVSSAPTSPLGSTATPGATPTFLSSAPALPDPSTILPANYPASDKPPPTDSGEVQQWLADLQKTGVQIPDISPTVAGGCPANLAAANNASRCWWTCGGCVRDTDITDCPTAMQWGLTYDDGPSFYTSQLLDYLDQQSLKSTFFVVGSRALQFPAILQAEYMGQHQIAVHTWSHPPLTTLSNEEIVAELGWSKKIIKDVLGVTPNMMRPPYGDIDDRVRAISLAMGLTPVMWSRISPTATFDTGDFNIHGGLISVQQVLSNWENIIGNATTRSTGFIVLEHDLFQQTVEVATGYILPDALAHQPKFTIKPVISCLNKPMSDAYIETNNNVTNPPPVTASVSGSTSGSGSQSTGGSKSSSNSQFSELVSTSGFAVVGSIMGVLAGAAAVL